MLGDFEGLPILRMGSSLPGCPLFRIAVIAFRRSGSQIVCVVIEYPFILRIQQSSQLL
jgi:hypothetical protein